MHGLQMLGMHKKPRKFIAVFIKPEKHADAHIVYAALHCAVHSLCVISVIMLGACGVQIFIAFFMICFLEKNICADSGFFKLFVVFNRGGGNINIHTADSAVFMLNRINRFNAIKDIFNGVVDRVLARFDCKALVPHILKRDNFLFNLILSELFSGDMLVFLVIRAIKAAVYTII